MHEEIEERHHVAILAPTGTLDASSADELRDRLLAAAAEEPHALLVDVTELTLPARTTLFADVAEEVARWPGVQLHVVDPNGRLPADECVHRTVADAMASIGEPPPRRVARCMLPNTRSGGSEGRAFVRACCRRWHIDNTRAADAVWVANELIENTIRHTPYPPAVRVELRSGELTVAVSDDDPRPPKPDPDQWPLHGLAAVDKLASAWGTMPIESGGKVVWAAL